MIIQILYNTDFLQSYKYMDAFGHMQSFNPTSPWNVEAWIFVPVYRCKYELFYTTVQYIIVKTIIDT